MSKGIKLANGLTPEDEQYAALLAQGSSQADAYRQVWPDEADGMKVGYVYSAASKRANKVRQRVEALIEASARDTAVSVGSLTREIEADREYAFVVGNAGAAVQATKLKAHIHGHLKVTPPVGDLLAGIVTMLASLDPGQSAKDITISGTSHEIPPDTPPPPRSGNGPSS